MGNSPFSFLSDKPQNAAPSAMPSTMPQPAAPAGGSGGDLSFLSSKPQSDTSSSSSTESAEPGRKPSSNDNPFSFLDDGTAAAAKTSQETREQYAQHRHISPLFNSETWEPLKEDFSKGNYMNALSDIWHGVQTPSLDLHASMRELVHGGDESKMSGVERGLEDFASGFSSPFQLALMIGTWGTGTFLEAGGAAALKTAGFTAEEIPTIVRGAKQLATLVKTGEAANITEAAPLLEKMGLDPQLVSKGLEALRTSGMSEESLWKTNLTRRAISAGARHFGKDPVSAEKMALGVQALVNMGFNVDMAKTAIIEFPRLSDAIHDRDWEKVQRLAVEAGSSAVFAGWGMSHLLHEAGSSVEGAKAFAGMQVKPTEENLQLIRHAGIYEREQITAQNEAKLMVDELRKAGLNPEQLSRVMVSQEAGHDPIKMAIQGNHLLEAAGLPDRIKVPLPVEPAKAAGDVALLHQRDGGGTYSLHSGDMKGKSAYAVAAHPERSLTLDHTPSTEELQQYIEKNADILHRRDRAVGTWAKDANTHILDIVATPPDEATALRLATVGRELPEEAYYDLKRGKVIDVPPSGESLAAKFGTIDKVTDSEASYVLADGRIVGLPAGMTHDAALGAKPTDDARVYFVNQMKVLRARFRRGRAGTEVVFSVPEEGVSEAQARQMRYASENADRIAIEVANPEAKKYEMIDEPNGAKVMAAINRLGGIRPDSVEELVAAKDPTILDNGLRDLFRHAFKENITDEHADGMTALMKRVAAKLNIPFDQFMLEHFKGFEPGREGVSAGELAQRGEKGRPDLSQYKLTDVERQQLLGGRDRDQRFEDNLASMPKGIKEQFVAAAKVGQSMRDWYQRSIAAFDHLTETAPHLFNKSDPAEMTRFSRFVAALSPNQSVRDNLLEAITSWTKWHEEGRPTDPKHIKAILHGGTFQGRRFRQTLAKDRSAKIPNAIKALTGQDMLTPEKNTYFKTPNFGNALLPGGGENVVNDVHQAGFFDLTDKDIKTADGYHAMSHVARMAAEELGWEPREAQAAIWSFWKTLKEVSGEKVGRHPTDMLPFLDDDTIGKRGASFRELMMNDPDVRKALAGAGVNLEKLDDGLKAIPTAEPAYTRAEQAAALKSLEPAARRLEKQWGIKSKRGTTPLFDQAGDTSFDPSTFAQHAEEVDRPLTERGNARIANSSEQFMHEHGITPSVARRVVETDDRAHAIADAYEAMKHDPNDPRVKASYNALKDDIKDQWNYATKKMGVRLEPVNEDPYKGEGKPSAQMMKDVRENNRLRFWKTAAGTMAADHPMAEIDPETGLSYNDMFRAIHDLFGHAAEGFEFGPKGEENAWNAHRRMFRENSQPALASETKGQNSWVNSGKHLRDAEGNIPKKGEKGYLDASQRPFAEQKAGLLPPEFWTRPDDTHPDESQRKQLVTNYFDKLFAHRARSEAVRGRIEDLQEAETNPNSVMHEFWDKTFPALGEKGKANFLRQMKAQIGVQPGDALVMGKDAAGDVIAHEWRDITDTFFKEAKTVEDLEQNEQAITGLADILNEMRRKSAGRTLDGGLSPAGSGTSLLSNEELARNEVFYKVDKTGRFTFQGKQPDPTAPLRAGESVVAINKRTGEIRHADGDFDTAKQFGPKLVQTVFAQKALKGEIKGTTEFLKDGRALIRGFQSGDISTLLHEIIHVFRRTLTPEEMRRAEKIYNVKDGKWTVAQEERFARDGERQHLDGIVADKPELQDVFTKMKGWLRDIYKDVANSSLRESLTDEKRAMWDSIYGIRSRESNPVGMNDARIRELVNRQVLKSKYSPEEVARLKRIYDPSLMSDKEREVGKRLTEFTAQTFEKARQADVLKEAAENYVTHVWDKTEGNPAAQTMLHQMNNSGNFHTNTDMARQRILNSAFEGRLLGMKLKYDNPIALAAHNRAEFGKIIAARRFLERLRGDNVRASDGRPMVALAGNGRVIENEDGSNPAVLVNPNGSRSIRIADKVIDGLRSKGELDKLITEGKINKLSDKHGADFYAWDTSTYRSLNHSAFRDWNWMAEANGAPVLLNSDLRVHPAAEEYMRRFLGLDKGLKENAVARQLLKGGTKAKRLMLSLSPFHLIQEGGRAILTGVSPFGMEKIDLAHDPVLEKGVELGLTSMGKDYHGIEQWYEGLHGGHSGNLIEKIPGVGKLQNDLETFLFEKYIPSLKARAFKHLVERYEEKYPEWTEEKRYQVAAADTNERFGGINYRRMGRSALTQDTARLLTLAPDWLESELRSMARIFGDEGKVARADMAKFSLYLWGAARVLNYVFTQKGNYHVPFGVAYQDKDGKEKVISIRTLPTDILHAASDPGNFLTGRASPFVRTGVEMYTSRDEYGRKLPTHAMWADIARNYLPLSLQSVVKQAGGAQPLTSRTDQLVKAGGLTVRPNRTEAMKTADDLASNHSESGPVDVDKVGQHRAVIDFEDKLTSRQMTPGDVFKAVEDGDLHPNDAKQIMKNYKLIEQARTALPNMDADTAKLVTRASRLQMKEFMQVWDEATPTEQIALSVLLRQKTHQYYKKMAENVSPKERPRDPTYRKLRALFPNEAPW